MGNILKYSKIELLFNMPLYEKLTVNITEIEKVSREEEVTDDIFDYVQDIYEEKYPVEFNALIEFLLYEDRIYGYCSRCKRENSMQILKLDLDGKLKNKTLYGQLADDFDNYDEEYAIYELKNRINILIKDHEYFTKTVYCSHDKNHKFIFIYNLYLEGENLILQKVGQNPSSVDLHNRELDKRYSKYKNYKVIKSDLNKALICYHNNFSIGGFLYLRRVLESIVEDKYIDIKENLDKTKQEEFESHNVKFKEKIEILKEYLPNYLTENKYIYSVLSKGVHSLTEEDCNKYFNIVENSIYIIIEELLELQEKENRKKRTEKFLNEINSEINNN
ncbi:hypothetical protein [Romboutsia lituseburensis]|uniref:Uncharacterized protein n=1 Tax=Romboutsia lituseburensis DSM 797 TaxID=1121325 RepID=A0A1G9T3H7_9FIRM|nr:hypothetical protein [Romboutsia lituseburensis]CEH36022.1 Hypothetical protein RLITU_3459 [Romboutsia lituseburensis]SDM42178.1 hypothetical protein SAMN04515677_11179 [Romboutsia lituseburensis DSM 797]